MSKYQGKYQRKSRSRPFFRLGVICGILALAFALYVGGFLYGALKARSARYQTVRTYVTPVPEPETTVPETTIPETTVPETTIPETTVPETTIPEATEPQTTLPETTEPETTQPTEPPRFPTIDFTGLREKNPDVVGWLQIPALEVINYPVVLGQDNAYYTSHGWDGEESGNGAIFLDFHNQGDFSQVHNILYGHCMKDGSMFQSLGKWEGPEFYKNNDKTVLLYLPGETRVYEIFAVERVDALNDRVYKTDYIADETWEAALSETHQKSQHGADMRLTAQAEVLTLSTCVGDMSRLVVHAVCVERVP